MIYVDKKIVVVDFSIRDSKTYTFFINDELCEVKLERKDLKMVYTFEINQDANTPRNQQRKKEEKKHLKQSFAFFGLVLLGIILAAFYFSTTLKNQKSTVQLLQNPSKTVATVNVKYENDQPIISYFFIAKNKNFNAESDIAQKNKILLSNGMPLESGDEFMLEYAIDNPKINKIHFESPTEKQLIVYKSRALEKFLLANPNIPEQQAKCQLDVAFSLKGLPAYADFYFQKTPPEDNTQHNQNTYQKLTRSLLFQKKVEQECW